MRMMWGWTSGFTMLKPVVVSPLVASKAACTGLSVPHSTSGAA